LTLGRALELADDGNPAIRASRHRTDAARSRIADAAKRATPSLSLAVENVGGSFGTERTESSLLIEQPVEWGGDRAARAGLAGAQVAVREAEGDGARLGVRAATAERFLEAWTLQERARRLAEAESTGTQAVAAARERLREGAGPRAELVRAEGFLALREIESRRARVELSLARRRLALQWGAEQLDFESLLLADPPQPREAEAALAASRLESHPERRLAAAERETERWRVREAEAARRPNLSLSAGARHLEEAGGTGLLFGVSLPLPFSQPGRGAVAASRSEHAAAEEQLAGAERRLGDEARAARERSVAAWDAWTAMRDRVQPAAAEAVRLVISAYRAGRLGYLDVQDAQRGLIEADLMLVDAVADAWRARVTLDAFAGGLETSVNERNQR
jgi:cobalt-zinc-cadmium efflux system outer membrane protein